MQSPLRSTWHQGTAAHTADSGRADRLLEAATVCAILLPIALLTALAASFVSKSVRFCCRMDAFISRAAATHQQDARIQGVR